VVNRKGDCTEFLRGTGMNTAVPGKYPDKKVCEGLHIVRVRSTPTVFAYPCNNKNKNRGII
jgi:hypothetical protein